MPSASIYIRDQPYADGTAGIFIRIIHDRKVHLRQIIRWPADQVDHRTARVRGRSIEAHKANQLIGRTLAEANEYLIDCKLKGIDPDPAGYLHGAQRGNTIADHIRARGAEKEAAGGFRNAAKHTSTANRIAELRMNVNVEDVTPAWLRRLDAELVRLGNNPNTRGKHFKIIHATMREIDGLADPFKTFKKPSNRVTKTKLTADEVAVLAGAELTGREAAARDMFLFAMYARGMRAFDVMTLQWPAVAGGRLRYVSRKTGKDQDIEITPGMQAILERMSGNSPYIFPFVKVDPAVYGVNPKRYLGIVNRDARRVNLLLRSVSEFTQLGKHITMHSARHTFAYLADRRGLPIGTIQQLLDHGKATTTAGYIESLRISDELDRAVDGMFT